CCSSAKVARTSFAPSIVTWHSFSPTTFPQPSHTTGLVLGPDDPSSVTSAPPSYSASHSSPHSMPPGELVTVPVPVPSLVTSRCCSPRLNFAVTAFAASIVTSHSFEPLTVPGQVSHSTGSEPASGVPVSLTRVPWAKPDSQVVFMAHSIP